GRVQLPERARAGSRPRASSHYLSGRTATNRGLTMGQWPENRLQAYMPMDDLEDVRDLNFTDIRGFQILNTTGHKVGSVKDVFVDPNTREPGFALLVYQKFLNFNTKSLLVPWSELTIGPDYVRTRTADHLLPEA